jgi:hypothetical protein
MTNAEIAPTLAENQRNQFAPFKDQRVLRVLLAMIIVVASGCSGSGSLGTPAVVGINGDATTDYYHRHQDPSPSPRATATPTSAPSKAPSPAPSKAPTPAPTKAPTPAPTATPGGQYADANLPAVGWQFPLTSNPFTVPACSSDPCSPTLDSNSSSEVSTVMNGGFSLGVLQIAQPGTNGWGQSDEFPVYYASASDPTYTVNCDGVGGCGPTPVTIHIPNGAKASVDGDHHMTVIYLPTNTEYDFWEFNDNGTGASITKPAKCDPWESSTFSSTCATIPVSAGVNPVSGNNTISTSGYSACTTGSFAGNVNTCAGGAVAADTSVQPGLLDPRELLAQSIKHVIFVSTPCNQGSYVFPANNTDGQLFQSACNGSVGPQEGQRMWLDLTDAQINALSAHTWVKTILHQMHDYGFMFVDTDGAYPWNIDVLDDNTFLNWGLASQWNQFFNEVTAEGDASLIGFSNNASHLPIPTTGLSQSNFHILSGCVNTKSC